MVEHEASDLYLTGDAPPIYRIHGATKPTDAPPFNNEQLEALALVLLRGGLSEPVLDQSVVQDTRRSSPSPTR